MKLPIRYRVALYVTVSFAAVIASVSLVLTEVYERYTFGSIEVTLQSAASSIANRLAARTTIGDIEDVREDVAETITPFENKIGVIRVGILNARGEEILSINDNDSLAVISRARKKHLLQIKGRDFVSASSEFEITDSTQGTVIALASRTSAEDSVGTVRGLALILAPITILIVGIGSVIIARKALRPLERIASQIDRMSTDRQLSSLEVPHTGDEIERVGASFNSLSLRIRSLMDSQRNFLQDASHELKTPLTVIQAEIEMLLMKPGITREEADNLRQLMSEVEYASRLAIDLIYLSRLESTETTFSSMPLDPIVKGAMDIHAPVVNRKKISVNTNFENAICVYANRELLQRALSNVIENAVKYTPRGGQIVVTTAIDDKTSSAVVTVKDNGVGISQEELPRVFDRFYRAAKTRGSDVKGSGLGLSISKRIVEQHKGDITITSGDTTGTVVEIRIPLG
ncbi:MAG TPA: HAMP domain-containing sensor histidine kinase [Candidatus Kryptonia bacterium]